MGRNEPSSYNGISLTIYLLLILSIYGGFKYLPVYWQRTEIEEMMMSVISNAHKVDDYALQATIIKRLRDDFQMTDVTLRDVVVARTGQNSWVQAKYYYIVTIDHYVRKHTFEVTANARRRIIDL